MIVNAQYFKEAGNYFMKHGEYQSAPYKSKEYYEYWREEKRRCLEGYTVGGHTIPGKYYFYLNFFPMWRKPTHEEIQMKKVSAAQKKILGFPDFWKIQHDWHIEKEAAFRRPFGEGNHMIAFKTRACGWSYMDASEGVYNYNFIPGAKSFYLAMLEKYLLGEDGILLKAWDALDHLNDHTQGFWKKNRQRKNTELIKEAGYYDDSGTYKGYKSRIAGIVIDNPRKTRGARGIKITLEEIGSFKHFLSVLEALRPLVEEPPDIFGQISAFGTGGEEGPYIEEAEEVFNNPLKYNFAPFSQIFEPEYEYDTTGYFVPCTLATSKYIDEYGSPMIEEATKFWESEYAKFGEDSKALDRFKAEHPMYPSDIFQRAVDSIFDRELAKRQMNRLKKSTSLQAMVKKGEMFYNEEGKIDFRPLPGLKEVPYPARGTTDLTGCIVVVYRPDTKNMYPGRYVIVHDPWYKDEPAQFSSSIGSAYVVDLLKEVPVAWYHGRPKKDVYYRKLFELAEFYGATIQAEIAGGGEDVIRYAKQNKKLHMLEYEPEMWHNRELMTSRNKAYLMNMTTDRKKTGLIYFADWLTNKRGVLETGEPVFNINRVYDEYLLSEIIKFKDDGNFDRISAMVVAMYMMKEMHAITQMRKRDRDHKNKRGFFERPLFVDKDVNNFIDLTNERP